jgi:steroid delta-isomerase-like uncharacterized protein
MTDIRTISAEFNEAFNSHDDEHMRACYADNAVFTGPGDVRLEGPEAIVEYAMTWIRAFPDARATVKNEIVADPWVITQVTFQGTHTDTLVGPAGEIPATNKSATGRAAELIRVENGKVVEDHLYFDNMEIMAQLGLVPEAAATA